MSRDTDLSELRDATAVATEGVQASMERARLLVCDAVARLLSSFSVLQTVVGQQRELLLQITGEIRASGGEGFAKATIQLLDEFVAQVVRVSHESMRMIERLEDTSEHVDCIVQHAKGIDKLARETRFIALNARIETQRTGSAGNAFKVIAEEVKRLAVASAELSDRIRNEVSACHDRLGQARFAAGTLAGHDMTTAIDSHDHVVQLIHKLDSANGAMDATLKNVDDGIAEAVRALQFEDMVNQLLGDAAGKVRKLGALLVAAAGAMEGGASVTDLCQAIRELGRQGSVAQTSLDRGSVELF